MLDARSYARSYTLRDAFHERRFAISPETMR